MSNSIPDQFRLNGKSAVIFGGNRGLGLEMAKALSEAGADICIASRNEEMNSSALNLLSPYNNRSISHCCDVTVAENIYNTIQAAEEHFGKIDILIYSAGINVRGRIEDISLDDFNKVQQVNVTGAWLACKAVVPVMKKNGYGRIIHMGSIFSVTAIAERTPYAVSKETILQLTKSLAIEMAKDNITVNAILPGPFATEMNLPIMNDPEKFQSFMSKIPMGRWGELNEIGGVALFLSSQASSFITGSAISVDGGWVAQ
ncbi:MAG TPA: SDR family oxidoreductase [Flavitalea sp.]|nr:SDR family oxidoreductase [Flavitalea sp.]